MHVYFANNAMYIVIRYCVLISLFAFFILICVHCCIGVVVVEINSIPFNIQTVTTPKYIYIAIWCNHYIFVVDIFDLQHSI